MRKKAKNAGCWMLDAGCWMLNAECWSCGEEFEFSGLKVRDHCHFSGKFRGSDHSKCNLQFRKPNFTPVIFHKLSGYDSHIFISQLGENKGKVKAIPNTDEKYISFSKNLRLRTFEDEKGKEKKVFREIRFIDSFKFMACPLAGLVSNLSLKHFVFLERNFGEKHKLLSRKGIYPYDWMNSFERFKEDSLPPRKSFIPS